MAVSDDGSNHAASMRVLLFNANVEPLTNQIIACAIEVHRELGPGLLESVYQECLVDELQSANIEVESDGSSPSCTRAGEYEAG